MPSFRRMSFGVLLIIACALVVGMLRDEQPASSPPADSQRDTSQTNVQPRPVSDAASQIVLKEPATVPDNVATLPEPKIQEKTARHRWPIRWIQRPWKSLYQRRYRAVWRGLKWMERFIARRWDPDKLGVDAVYIFLEVAQTSVEPQLREYALKRARQLALKMKRHFLRPRALSDSGDLLDAFDLLAEAPHLGLTMPRLLAAAKLRYRKISSARELYGVSLQTPAALSMDDFFDLLINTYIMEKLDIAHTGAFPVTFGLSDLVPHVYARRYRRFPTSTKQPADQERLKKAEDDAFLATHVAYVLNYYGRIRLYPSDIPGLYRYLQSSFQAIIKQKDVELIGEYVDVYRSAKWDETNHAQARIGTMFLLDTQARDGSWGDWKKEKNPYDAIHFTWCAVLGLRERFFLKDTLYEKRLRRMLHRAGVAAIR